MWDNIYVNGDSYSATCDKHPVYSDYLDGNVVNAAIQGSNNERIFRSSVEHLQKFKNTNTLAIIGFSFMSRHEAWYTGTDKKLLQICYENNAMDFPITKTLFDPILLITADHLLNHDHKDAHAKSLIMYENFTQVLIDFCTKLEMFTGWLENNSIKYFIFNAPDLKDWSSCNWDFIKQTTAYVNLINNNNIYNFFDFSIPEFSAQHNKEPSATGHMDGPGHKAFSEFLKEHV